MGKSSLGLKTYFTSKTHHTELIAIKIKEMTKEQILAKNSGSDFWELEEFGFVDFIIKAMQEYADQELAKERERSEKLAEALDIAVTIIDNNEQHLPPMTLSMRLVRQILSENRGLPPETTGNQTAC